MEQIPTAEEFLSNKSFMRSDLQCETNYQLMIEFAKLHVTAALKAASEKAETVCDEGGELGFVDEQSILNSYPLDKIN